MLMRTFDLEYLEGFCEECVKIIVQGRTGYKIGGGVVGLLVLPKIIGVKC